MKAVYLVNAIHEEGMEMGPSYIRSLAAAALVKSCNTTVPVWFVDVSLSPGRV